MMTKHARGPRLVPRLFGVLSCVSVLTLAASVPAQAAHISVPSTPRSVHAVAGSAAVTVTWTKPSSTGGSPILRYLVTADPPSRQCTTSATKCIVTGLVDATSYTFTVRAQNKVGAGPVSLASPPVTPEAPNSSDFAITPINSPAFSSLAAVAAFGTEVWAVSKVGGSAGKGLLSQINAVTGKVTQIESSTFSSPDAVSSDGSHVWVANANGGPNGTGSVSEIDISSGLVTEIDDVSFNDPVAISSDGSHVWVANVHGGHGNAGTVSEIDIASAKVTEISDPSFDDPTAISSDGSHVWVTNAVGKAKSTGTVSEIDIASAKVTEINDVSFDFPVAVSSNGTLVIVANASGGTDDAGSVSEIVAATGAVTQVNSPLLISPSGVATSATDAWVSDAGGGTYNDGAVLEIDLAAGGVSSMSSPSLLAPNSIALSTSSAWAANPNGAANAAGSLTEIDTTKAAAPYGHGLHIPRNPPSDIDPSPDYLQSGPCATNVVTGAQDCLNPCPSDNGTFPAYSDLPACSLYILQAINAARQSENVEPMVLPTNWAALSAPEQLFALADLERTSRGLAPYLGISAALTRAAQAGSARDVDPKLAAGFAVAHEAGGTPAMGAVWADEFSTLAADFGWMYSDGWGGSAAATFNYDCTSARASACWVHRDILLGKYTGSDCNDCELGVGFSIAKVLSSFAAIVEKPAGAAPAMTFTWAKDVVPYLPKQ
jgi:sugar lactone lactonase YvrE